MRAFFNLYPGEFTTYSMVNTHITLYSSVCHVYNVPVEFSHSQSVQGYKHVLLKLSQIL